MPVTEVVGDRLLLTSSSQRRHRSCSSGSSSFPIGIYSATHQYSWGDYGLTFLGFLGLATPNFLLALVLLYFANVWFGTSIGGLMDPRYIDQPWSWAKVRSVLAHLWMPVIVIGTSGTAGMIRRLRANLLDELQKQYVVTARAKGLPPRRLLLQISAAHVAQPVHRRHRQPAAAGGLGRGHRLGGAVAADHRADAARGAAEPGHVPGRLVPDVPRAADRGRHAGLRPCAGRARSRASAFERRRRRDERTPPMTPTAGSSTTLDPAPFDPASRRAADARAGALLPRLAVAADVVEVPAPPRRGGLAASSCSSLYGSILVRRDPRALRPAHARNADFIYAPPQRVHLFHEGSFVGPFVYGYDIDARHGDAEARLHRRTGATCSRCASSASGDAYKFWGLFDGTLPPGLPGRGRHALPARHRPARPRHASRIIYGARISLTIGLIGIAIASCSASSIGGARRLLRRLGRQRRRSA